MFQILPSYIAINAKEIFVFDVIDEAHLEENIMYPISKHILNVTFQDQFFSIS